MEEKRCETCNGIKDNVHSVWHCIAILKDEIVIRCEQFDNLLKEYNERYAEIKGQLMKSISDNSHLRDDIFLLKGACDVTIKTLYAVKGREEQRKEREENNGF